jgi:hypothetical protein
VSWAQEGDGAVADRVALSGRAVLGTVVAMAATGGAGGWSAPAPEAAERAADGDVRLGHHWVGTEHVLVSLLSGYPDELAARLLKSAFRGLWC